MASAIIKWMVWCETDSKWEAWYLPETDPLVEPTTCPNNGTDNGNGSAHVITAGLTKWSTHVKSSDVEIQNESLNTKRHPETIGYEMCDRDLKLLTCTWDDHATLTVSGATTDGDVLYCSSRRSEHGNDLSVEHVTGPTGSGSENRALSVSKTINDITITFGTDGSGNTLTPTGQQIVDLVNGAGSPCIGLTTAAIVGTGAGSAALAVKANLSGGTSHAVSDLKMNPVTQREEQWHECTLKSVYKYDGNPADPNVPENSNNMVMCEDQNDCNTNGVLSVFEYYALHQTNETLIPWDLKSGAIYVDETITLAEKFDHRAYAIAAPDIPASLGGVIRVFDGFLGHLAGKTMSVDSPTAKNLDPALMPGMSNVLRIYILHPAASKKKHILRLLTYRPGGTT